MKIAHLMGSLNRGGAEVLLLDVCRNVQKAGLSIMLVHRKEGDLLQSFLNAGLEVIRLSPKSAWDIGYLFKLRKLVQNRGIDILHAHQNIDALFAMMATVGMRTKVLLSVHGHGLDKSLMVAALRNYVLLKADLILFVSKSQRAHYFSRYGIFKDSTVIYNGLDFSKMITSSSVNLRLELKLSHEGLLLGCVGNFTNGRDQITVCRFLVLLARTGIDFTFLFVGAPSPAEPELFEDCVNYCQVQGIGNRVIFMGSRSDVASFLPQLDAFVYSTVHDTFGIAVVEAITTGIPVFVNDWSVMREVTNEGEWAILYASENEADLLEKFLNFYHNQFQYRERARQNAIQARERYSIKNYLQNLKAAYGSLIEIQKP